MGFSASFLSHQAQQLVSDPVDALFIENTDPRADRPFDGRIPDQVVVLDHGKKMQESLRPSGSHLVAVHLIQRIVEIFLPCFPHTDIHQIWKLLPVQLAQSCLG